MAEARAVLFDLDDTLHPLERFVASGFHAVAAAVEARWRVPRALALDTLSAAVETARGRELQILAERFALGREAVGLLVEVIRGHQPTLALPALSASVLAALAGTWRLAIVTNGRPDIQARKVRALGLERLVDAVILADEWVEGGKPGAAPFLEACRRLQVAPSAAVFVGDDPVCDIAGARRVGMKTIWLPGRARRLVGGAATPADHVAASLAEVPAAAARLLRPEWRTHVA